MEHAKEQEFLRLAVKSAIQDVPQACFEEFRSDALDWQYIREQAQRHRISGLLYHQRAALPTLPAAVLQAFRDAYQETYLQNTLWEQQLTVMLREFAKQGIFPIALKGIALAKMLYRHLALRPMQDIDLLLRPEELTPAAAILDSLGYSRLPQLMTYVSRWHQAYEEQLWRNLEPQGHHLPVFIKKLGTFAICVELHHHLAPGISAAEVRSSVVADVAPPLRVLVPEYFLLHLCVHLHAHAQGEKMPLLLWYCDIGKFVNLIRLDWDVFRSLCRQFQLEAPVFQSLAQVCRLFELNPPLPLPGGEFLPPAFPLPEGELTLQSLYRKIFSEWKVNPELSFLQTAFKYSKLKGIRYLWECIFPSQKFLIARYNIRQPRFALIPYYYLLRFSKACFRGLKLAKDLILKNLLPRRIEH